MYQSVLLNGQVVEEDLLWKNCPEAEKGNYEYLLDVIDWEKNIDPDFHKNNYMKPKYVRPLEDMTADGYIEEWICYKCNCVSAKRLTILPGRSAVIKDGAPYGLICLEGHGTFGKWEIESPALIRYGQLTHDEYFVTAKAAKEGVKIVNHSKTDPIVILKHFSDNSDLTVE